MIEPITLMIRDGGWVLLSIAAASIVAWMLILDTWLLLLSRRKSDWTRTDAFPGDAAHAAAMARTHDRQSFEAQFMPLLRSETQRFYQPLRMVAVLAAVMPLMGLLGTVMGMMQTFGALDGQQFAKVDALSGGISQALITTQAGLVMSVPVLLAHGYVTARVRRYLDRSTVQLKTLETAVCLD